MTKRKRRDSPDGDALDDAVPIENDAVGLGLEAEAAERSRPDLPDETPDGLDDLHEEVRRMAEDVPTGALGDRDPPLPYVGEHKIIPEPIEIVGNDGDLPSLTDQGEEERDEDVEAPVPRKK